MFDKFIIYFFYFFLLSRYFSEKLKILPKWIDVINFPLFVILLIFLIFNLTKKSYFKDLDNVFVRRVILAFTVSFFISVMFNQFRILLEASVLFYIGFMEGPILFVALNKLCKDPLKLTKDVNKLFFVILIINLIIVFLLDIPAFLITGNPDVISGTYGNNTYQFSMLLLICGGYLLGYNSIKKYRTWFIILSQIIILTVFYLSQFRAGLPFFFLSYFFMIGYLYGKKILLKIIPITLFSFIIIIFLTLLASTEEKVEALKYNDWFSIISEPDKYINYGKFKMYSNIIDMWSEYPEVIFIGSGPGNLLSRANNTFSNEVLVSNKGVASLNYQLFGIKYPYYSELHNKYVRFGIKKEAVFGTWQLSAPYTSYLSALGEIGIVGGFAIIIMYLYIIVRSIKFYNIIRLRNKTYIPLSISLIGGSIYLFLLAFLDNYWEIARVTLPIWILFWSVKTIANNTKEISDNN
jgi:hypothetical protein